MFTMRIEGGEELAQALDQLSTRLTKRIVMEALTDNAEPMRASAASHAPRRPPAPDIADNIVISPARRKEVGEDIAAVVIGPARGFAYGLPLEYGTVKMSAHPFMRPAFDTEAEKAIRGIGESLWRELAARGVQRSATIDVPVSGPGSFV